MENKFCIRLVLSNKILYESPEEGDTFESKSNNPIDLAEGIAKAINKLGIKEIKAIVVSGK